MKKRYFCFLVFLMIALCAICFAVPNSPVMAEENITVHFCTFNTNQADIEQEYAPGQTFGTLPQPTKNGYQFGGWYADINLTQQIEETSVVSQEISYVYPKWIAKDVYISQHLLTFVAESLSGYLGKDYTQFAIKSVCVVDTMPTDYVFRFAVGATDENGNVLDFYSLLCAYYKTADNKNFDVEIYAPDNANVYMPKDCTELMYVNGVSQNITKIGFGGVIANNITNKTDMFKGLSSLISADFLGMSQNFDIILSSSYSLTSVVLPSSFGENNKVILPSSSWIVSKNEQILDFEDKNTTTVCGGLVCKKFDITIQNYGDGQEPEKLFYITNGKEQKITLSYVPQKAHNNFVYYEIKLNTLLKSSTISANVLTVPSGATGNIIISPVFETIKHKINFYNYDGLFIKTQLVNETASASYFGNLPTKPQTQDKHYDFLFWANEIDGTLPADLTNVMEEKNVYAVFEEKSNTYNITLVSQKKDENMVKHSFNAVQDICEGITVKASTDLKNVRYGTDVCFKLKVNYKHKITGVFVNGVSTVLNNNSFVVSNLAKDTRVVIEYKELSFFVTTIAFILYSCIIALGLVALLVFLGIKYKNTKFMLKLKKVCKNTLSFVCKIAKKVWQIIKFVLVKIKDGSIWCYQKTKPALVKAWAKTKQFFAYIYKKVKNLFKKNKQ